MLMNWVADFILFASLQAYMQRAALYKLQRKDDEARADFQKVRLEHTNQALGRALGSSDM